MMLVRELLDTFGEASGSFSAIRAWFGHQLIALFDIFQ